MNLTEPRALREFLDRHRLSPRKGLGQHFLCSEAAVVAVLGCLQGYEAALEIGPGPGVLTAALVTQLERVVALEIDAAMVAALKESAPNAEVMRVDALKVDLSAILSEMPEPRAVVSNLPYYITAPLITAIAVARCEYGKAVLMMQKEVARRLMARPGEGERGSISVYLQALFTIRKVADVPAQAFLPPPKVDSTILEFVPIRGAEYEETFFEFVRKGFTQPRKTLVNNLSELGKEKIASALAAMGLEPRVRPHELTLEEWETLAEKAL